MSMPIYEDEIIIDEDGTIRLKKDGTILEKNGVWLARNYYLTTREAEKELEKGMHESATHAQNQASKKEEQRLGNTKSKKQDFEKGSEKIKNNWWKKFKAMFASRETTK